MLYMTQIGTRPPRFSIQVNSRQRVTRDYAYFVENRLRERYGLEGIPLVIDFAERKRRSRAGDVKGRAVGCSAGPRRATDRRCPRRHDPVRRQRVPVHVRVRHGGPPGQGRRPDLRRRPRRRAARRSDRPRGVRDAREHRPRRRVGRDLDRRPTSTSRRSRARRSARSATSTPTSASRADSCAVLNAIDKQSPDIAQGVDAAYETRTDPSDDDELDIAGAGDQGMMFGYASQRDRRADAAADLARAQARQAPRGRPQGRGRALPAPGRQDAGLGPLPRRPARSRSRSC